MHQLIDINWKYLFQADKYIPTAKLFDLKTKEVLKIDLPGYNFALKMSDEKYCTGYYLNGEYKECALQTVLSSSTANQCDVCERLQGFKSTFFYGADPNENMQKYLSQKHFIYLAYFEPGLLKVGTASESRKNIRPIEQDALIYAYIAESDGFNVQKAEKYISKNFGITEHVNSSHKLKYISRKPNTAFAYDLINRTIDKFHSKIDWKLEEELSCSLIDRNKIEIKNLSTHENIHFPTTFEVLDKELNLFGVFSGLRGRYLIIKSEQKEFVFDTNFLMGRTIATLSDYHYNEPKKDIQFSLF